MTIAVQSTLTMKTNNGTPAAFRLVGATPSQIGAAFGTVEATASANNARQSNRIIRFESGNSPEVLLLAWVGPNIWSYNGTTWTSRHTISVSGTVNRSGLYVLNVLGQPLVCGVYIGTGFSAFTTADGIVYTDYTPGTSWSSSLPFSVAVFNNVIYNCDSQYPGHISWDPTNPTVTTTSVPVNMSIVGCHDMCVFKNALYQIAENTSIGNKGYWLWAFNLGTWSPILKLPAGTNATPLNQGDPTASIETRPVLFDGGDGFLYAIYLTIATATNYGYQCAQITAMGLSASASDISTVVLPSTWLFNGTNVPGTFLFNAFSETESTPGTPTGPVAATPAIQILMGTNFSNSNWNYFQWNGPATLLGVGGVANDFGGDVSMCVPNTKDGSSDRIWVPSDFGVRLQTQTSESTSQLFSFQAYGPVGNEIKSFTQLYSDLDQTPVYQALLSGSVPGVVGTAISVASNGAALPTGTINVATTVGFTPFGSFLVTSSANSTAVAVGSNGQSLPQSTIFVASTAGFPASGYIQVLTGAGLQTVTYTSITGGGTPSFNGCTNGTGLMTTGTSTVVGFQIIAYTAVTATSFTGCTGGTGNLSTNNTVLSGPSPAPTLNGNNYQLDNVTCDGNLPVPTTYYYYWNSTAQPAPGPITNNKRVRTAPRVF